MAEKNEPCPASMVFEIIDASEATAAGVTCCFQCQDCGTILAREDEPHEAGHPTP